MCPRKGRVPNVISTTLSSHQGTQMDLPVPSLDVEPSSPAPGKREQNIEDRVATSVVREMGIGSGISSFSRGTGARSPHQTNHFAVCLSQSHGNRKYRTALRKRPGFFARWFSAESKHEIFIL